MPATKLCEIIRGIHTEDESVALARKLAAALGKESIIVERDDAGFVTSRLMTVLMQEAISIVEQGICSPEEIDKACQLAFGHKMGPLATADLTGLDIALRAGNAVYQQTGNAKYFPPQLLSRMVAAGQLGRKSGAGFYEYK